jgi:hypothetical protein
MFCINCGTQLPDEAKFCWKCGTPQKSSVQADELKWETCEIVWKMTSGALGLILGPIAGVKGYFWAKAIGPSGVYVAGKSQTIWVGNFYTGGPLPRERNQAHFAAHNALVAQLVNDGWEPTGDKGAEWWSNRFRRRVK